MNDDHARQNDHGAHAGHGHHGSGTVRRRGARSDGHGAGHGRGHHAVSHAGHERLFRQRFWVSLVLTIPVVAFSRTIADAVGYGLPGGPLPHVIAASLGTIVFLYGGTPFLRGALPELRNRQPGMMTLVSLAITAAFVASVVSLATPLDLEFWWELSTLVTVMLLGHWQEMRALGEARSALQAIAALLPDEAELIEGDSTRRVPVSELKRGDLVLVRPGARVPADGEVVEGEADVDESLITGESRPVAKGPGSKVVAGSVVAGSALTVRVTSVGEETTLAGIQRLVAEAEASRTRLQTLADRAAAALFYIAVLAGTATAVAWAALGAADAAVIRAVSVLVIACPHALGLAIPLVVAIGSGTAARQGVLIRDRIALERMRRVDTVLFDKTGTLTRGRHVVRALLPLERDEDELLRLAAAVEARSEHPLGRAIVAAAAERGLRLPSPEEFRARPGRGVEARVDGVEVAIGGPRLLEERSLQLPAPLREAIRPWQERGASILYVALDGRIAGAIALEDEVRPESREAVESLHRMGRRVAMVTGDSRNVAEAVAGELGIDEVFAEVLPEQKERVVAELQHRGHLVAMVGDGVNDAPALARADVGIAIGAGTDVAIQTAHIVLASDDPRGVVALIELSRRTYRKMIENLVWATGYNVVAIPAAAGAFAPFGFTLPPAGAALLMSLSTVVVAINALTLRGLSLRPAAS